MDFLLSDSDHLLKKIVEFINTVAASGLLDVMAICHGDVPKSLTSVSLKAFRTDTFKPIRLKFSDGSLFVLTNVTLAYPDKSHLVVVAEEGTLVLRSAEGV